MMVVKDKNYTLSSSSMQLVAIFIILATAIFFRFYRISEIPYGLWIDEFSTAVNALELIAGQTINIFGFTPLISYRPDWVQTQNLYLYAAAALQAMGGYGYLGVKFISIVPAILTVIITSLIAGRLYCLQAMFFGSMLLAVSHWHVVLSRWGWDQLMATALVSSSAYFLLGGRKGKNNPLTQIIAGALLGLSAYTYVGARLPLLAISAWLGIRAAVIRKQEARLFAYFIAPLLVWLSPLLLQTISQPDLANARVKEVSIFNELLKWQFETLSHNLIAYAGMLHYSGDPLARHNYESLPELSLIPGILFLLGLTVAICRLKLVENQILLIWLFSCLSGGIVSSEGMVPNAYRVGIMIPSVFLLICLGIHVLYQSDFKKINILLSLILFAVIVWEGVQTYERYFILRASEHRYLFPYKNGAKAYSGYKKLKQLALESKIVLLTPDVYNYPLKAYIKILSENILEVNKLKDVNSPGLYLLKKFEPKRISRYLKNHPSAMLIIAPDKNLSDKELSDNLEQITIQGEYFSNLYQAVRVK